jgi:hypothetical protein
MQGTFQRVRVNVLEMPAREMKVSTHLVSCGCPTMLGLSQWYLSKNAYLVACVGMRSIHDDFVLEAMVEQCLHHNTNASVVTS